MPESMRGQSKIPLFKYRAFVLTSFDNLDSISLIDWDNIKHLHQIEATGLLTPAFKSF